MIWIKKHKLRYFLIFLSPALFFYCLFVILPCTGTLLTALSARDQQGAGGNLGLQNFREMFNVQADPQFLPRTAHTRIFRPNFELPFTLSSELYKNLLATASLEPAGRGLLQEAYIRKDKKTYELTVDYNEFALYEKLSVQAGILPAKIPPLMQSLQQAATAADSSEALLADALATLQGSQAEILSDILAKYYKIFVIKNILTRYLTNRIFSPGVVGFTLFYTLVNLSLANIGALLLALALGRSRNRQKFLGPLFMLPLALSLIMVGYLWSLIFNTIMPALAGGEIWISNPRLAPLLISCAGIWRHSSLLLLIYLVGLQNIPREYLEAAELDGAARWQRYKHIIRPLLRPAVTAALLWSLHSSLKVFEISFAEAGTSGMGTNITSLVLNIYSMAFLANRWGSASAKASLLGVVSAGILTLVWRIMLKRERML